MELTAVLNLTMPGWYSTSCKPPGLMDMRLVHHPDRHTRYQGIGAMHYWSARALFMAVTLTLPKQAVRPSART